MMTELNTTHQKPKVLLMLTPFWTPLIPPLGISCLKSFLKKHDYKVTAVDANTDLELWEIYHNYNATLKQVIPQPKWGNFYNTSHEVLRNHTMAYLNRSDETEYRDFIKLLVDQYFFCRLSNEQVAALDEHLKMFFEKFEKYLSRLLMKENPEVVGISVLKGTLAASMFAFHYIKQHYPQMKTVMGGGIFAEQFAQSSPNFAFLMENSGDIDKIIIGEGESQFLKYLQGELSENQKVHSLQDNQVEILDLGTLDIPDFMDFDTQAYPQIATFASRSCPFQCSFCSETVQWGKFRKKSATQVVDEMVKLYQKHKFQLFLLGDSLLNPFIDELAQGLNQIELSLYFDGYLRADPNVCSLENTMLWRKAGYYRARLGVESGSQHVLDMMNKKITPEQIKKAVISLAKAGIKTTTYWVVGHPGETEQDFRQTLELIKELRDYIYEAECNPFQYYPKAQVGSNSWDQVNGVTPLFSEKMGAMLMGQTWVVNSEPSREELYNRIRRFVEHCKQVGVPNPYNLREIYLADDRWRKLHKNAVPLITDFKNKNIYVKENKDGHLAL